VRTIVRARGSCAHLFGCLTGITLIAASASPAMAQPQDVPNGSIIIARDVPIHNAFVPQDPGTPTIVRTVPGQDIFGSAIHNLVPLGDGEFAAITASTDARASAGATSANVLLGRNELLQRGTSEASMVANQSGGGFTAAIGSGMSALQQGLGVLGSVLSGGQK